ncbi:divergent PAP2 family protein [Halalkalibacterium halodurans]|jgi:acid phosphatase family membrane protein YuiD|uniref:BH3402 protein n=3 Tax=Halalkalibacterium halodurans TaxID=86665 RepID=Q9K7F9_HALH5|nr:divergent PAP2 family protein [Halalkalibacterium halodurans]MDY7223934.1 divergent PAP2 family protein [Halalkalibacterium halodurans]MDY7243155.1 divergent PAP2 family protein [Halalkalibacterium halodurans]MED4080676.1 divergent PAP2 family protein [Halalkalibacterium halodurans]MED4085637.1 divergent PAP2 family protein [Halalkalibacterium halodurans]MED4106363.1 divergent PAP2 family protein [Halalkalibacterium halodurans]
MELFHNFPLWAALIAIGVAQFVKVPLAYLPDRKMDWTLLTSTGGMPSSHSAAVTALATAIALEDGLDSPLFAISAVFGIIVMFDATGVRRHAGYHATVLNQLVGDFNKLVSELKSWPKKEEMEKRKELKELLGHQPIEVFFGALLGILLAFILYVVIY